MFSKFFKKNKNFLDSNSKNDLLHNVYLLYVVFAIAVLDIFYLLQLGDFYSATIFAAVGILISFISKNMIVILCAAVTITHLFKYGSKWREGFEEGTEEEEKEEEEKEGFEEDMKDEGEEDKEEGEEQYTESMQSENEQNEMTEESEKVETSVDAKYVDVSDKKDLQYSSLTEEEELENVHKMVDKHTAILDKLNKYQPLLSSIQSLSTTFGLNESSYKNDE